MAGTPHTHAYINAYTHMYVYIYILRVQISYKYNKVITTIMTIIVIMIIVIIVKIAIMTMYDYVSILSYLFSGVGLLYCIKEIHQCQAQEAKSELSSTVAWLCWDDKMLGKSLDELTHWWIFPWSALICFDCQRKIDV